MKYAKEVENVRMDATEPDRDRRSKKIRHKQDAYAIYLRKSRADIEAEKLGEGETLKRHREILTNYAAKHDLFVGHIYEEIVSGETIAARPMIQALINECYEGKYKGIIVIDVDRLSRGNQGDMQTIMDCLKFSNSNDGILVVTPTKTYDVAHNPDDEEYMEFVLFMSRREYKTIQKRLERGRRQAVVEGNYMSSYRPYGWQVVKTKAFRTLTPDPEESQIVRLMYKWMAEEGYTTGRVARRLTAMGIPTYTGSDEWNASTVKCIIENPVNKGKVRWNDRMTVKKLKNGEVVKTRPRSTHTSQYMEYDGLHLKNRIVDDETFAKANQRFTSDKTKYRYKLSNPLATLLVCKNCGRAMTYNSMAYRGIPARILHPSSQKCKVKSAYASDVMDAVVYGLKMQIEDFEMKVDNNPTVDEEEINMQIDTLQKELRKTERKLSKLFDAWEDESITDNEFVQRKQVNNTKIESIKSQITELESSIPGQVEYSEKIITLHQALDYLKDDSVPADIKNEYLKSLIYKIEFSRENDDEFILDIYLRD